MAEAVRSGYHDAELDEATRALLRYVDKLTHSLMTISEVDVAALREHGWSDRAIHDAAQICAYFNYINRIAEGLGVDLESGMPSAAEAAWSETSA